MQTIIRPGRKDPFIIHPLIFPMMAAALSGVPFHANTDAITRYVAESFPLHLAVHEVSPVIVPPVEYTQPHIHDDYDEINIIIASQDLVYKILLDDEDLMVSSNSCIWIPRGTLHAANVLQGTGYFIAMRIP